VGWLREDKGGKVGASVLWPSWVKRKRGDGGERVGGDRKRNRTRVLEKINMKLILITINESQVCFNQNSTSTLFIIEETLNKLYKI